MARAKTLLMLILSAALTHCNLGPSVKKGTAPQPAELRKVALLPLKLENELDTGTGNYLQKALRRELEASGYLVIESKKINDACDIGGCRDAKVVKRYGFDALVQLAVSDVSQNYFLLGIYNSIGGTLNFSNAQGESMVSVENKQRYRGGLIFNPGQIVEGLKTTFEERSEQKSSLLDTFVRVIVQKAPHPSSGAEAVAAPQITRVKFERRRRSRYLFCLEGSPANSASLLFDSARASLQEVRPGRYCALLPLPELLSAETALEVELKSTFGAAARRPVMAKPLVGCSLDDGVIHMERTKSGLKLSAGCAKAPDATTAAACEREMALCKDSTVTVFKAAQAGGPYIKTAELGPSFWKAKNGGIYPEAVYSALALSPNGKRSALLSIPVKE